MLTYTPDESVNEIMVMAGYVDKNILFMSKKKYDEEEIKRVMQGCRNSRMEDTYE